MCACTWGGRGVRPHVQYQGFAAAASLSGHRLAVGSAGPELWAISGAGPGAACPATPSFWGPCGGAELSLGSGPLPLPSLPGEAALSQAGGGGEGVTLGYGSGQLRSLLHVTALAVMLLCWGVIFLLASVQKPCKDAFPLVFMHIWLELLTSALHFTRCSWAAWKLSAHLSLKSHKGVTWAVLYPCATYTRVGICVSTHTCTR